MRGGGCFGKNVWSKTANAPSAAMATGQPRMMSRTNFCQSLVSASLPRKTCGKAILRHSRVDLGEIGVSGY